MNVQQKPLVELTDEALTILQRELGTANTIRFIRQFSAGFGDYTAERATHEEETLDELLKPIKLRRLKHGEPGETGVPDITGHQQPLAKIRQKYPRAYERWTEEEDEQLRLKYLTGARVKELAALLQRQPEAIESRLRKLGLTN